MEKTEPTFVPQWLKNNGSSNGGGSLSRSDDRSTSSTVRNKSFVNSNGRASGSDRTTSSYFRRSSSNNGSGNSMTYSNFGGRNRRDREWEKDKYDNRDKDKLVSGNGRHRDFYNPPQNTSSKFEMDRSTRSQPIRSYNNGTLNKGSSIGSTSRETIGTDFPTLRVDGRTPVSDSGRTTPPVRSPSFCSLSSGISAAIGGEKWTSALAEVPMLTGNKGTATSSVQQLTAATSSSLASGSSAGLNMAEAVAQGPSRAHTAPQLPVETQRLEELAIKKSRQLIPVTPSMPKALANGSDKQRTKAGMLHHSVSSHVIHYPRGAPLKNDAAKVSTLGKLQILKPAREKNGTIPFVKDTVLSPMNRSSENVTAPNNQVPDRKPVLTVLEKRPTSQAKSRNDFFNLVRKKSMPNTSSAMDNFSSAVDSKESSTSTDKIVEMDVAVEVDVALAPTTPRACENQISKIPSGPNSFKDTGNMENCECNGKKHPSFDPIFSEEEESAFLRSLGWEENADEDGLTEEEITAFYTDVTKYINSKPSLKILLQGVQPKSQLPLDSQVG